MRFLYLCIPFTCIRISLAAILAMGAFLYADFSVFTLLLFAAAAIHECGHLVFLKVLGANIYGITILPFGAVIRSDAAKLSYLREAAVALAGAAFNLAAFCGTGVFYLICRDKYSLFFCACNLFLALVNLMPIKTLDGARAAEALFYAKLSPEKAQQLSENISFLSLAVLTFAALGLLAYTGCNFSLIILCVYLFVSVYAKTYTYTS